jgi:hypothetical protein
MSLSRLHWVLLELQPHRYSVRLTLKRQPLSRADLTISLLDKHASCDVSRRVVYDADYGALFAQVVVAGVVSVTVRRAARYFVSAKFLFHKLMSAAVDFYSGSDNGLCVLSSQWWNFGVAPAQISRNQAPITQIGNDLLR